MRAVMRIVPQVARSATPAFAASGSGRRAAASVGGLVLGVAALSLAAAPSGCEAAMPKRLNSYIDHTVLKAEATPGDILKLCIEAASNHFAAVCVNSGYVKLAADTLQQLQGKDGPVKVCTVVGFPLGASSISSKVHETAQAIDDGADEIDMVIPVGLLKAGLYLDVKEQIRRVVDCCKTHNPSRPALCKVIIETSLLTDEEKRVVCKLASEAGADYVKTSTGFSTGGATVADVQLMHSVAKPYGVLVKASGGIKTRAFAEQLIEAGASRIGASSGITICKEGGDAAAGGASSSDKY